MDGRKPGPAQRAGRSRTCEAMLRKQRPLTRNGGILHYVLRQLAAKKAA
jgi:hypothetical protein